MADKALFNEWPERYDAWFATPTGKLVRKVEGELVNELLRPAPGEKILDAGCGTGVFTTDILKAGTKVAGLDISLPMLMAACGKSSGYPFSPVYADMCHLPFRNNSFDKAVSITAIEFIEDAQSVVDELFRVVKPGGYVVVATLNSLSLWAVRRREKTVKGQRHILENAFYRSPQDLLALSSLPGITRTAVHFSKDEDPIIAPTIEEQGNKDEPDTGAFVAVRWQKPPTNRR